MRWRAAALLLVVAMVGARRPASGQSSDDELAERVRRALAQEGLASVDVRADDGVVVLSGVVLSGVQDPRCDSNNQ